MNQTTNLERFAINLTAKAKNGDLDPIIGREEEIRRILQILSRRTKNNPVVVGESGVGKTAVIEGIAHKIASGDVPDNLKEIQIHSLDMGLLIAGAYHKGEFEDRLKGVVREVKNSRGKIVLFIDEIHILIGTGAGDGAMDAANLLKPALARGEMKTIGATTLNEYQKYFERDKALERRFQRVLVQEPSNDDSIKILRGIKEKFEVHHRVVIKDEAVIAAVELSSRYITDRHLPDKAIDLMDEACSKLRMELNSTPEIIFQMEKEITQMEIEKQTAIEERNEEKVKNIEIEIIKLRKDSEKINSKWQEEREIIENANRAKKMVEDIKFKVQDILNKTEKEEGDYKEIFKLREVELPKAQEQVKKSFTKLRELEESGEKLMREEVCANDIADVVSKITGIPVSKMNQSEKEKLLNLEEELGKRIIGQKAAVKAISDAIRINRSGLGHQGRPIGSFLFLGTSGVGKTESGKALAEFLFDDETMITRIDMSEYQEAVSSSKMIGAPPGYVGYDEGGQLTEAVRRRPYSVVLFDEIEKAHPDVFNVLLQVLDDGRLTDNKGRVADFKNTIIIMTSNMGSEAIISGIKRAEDLKYRGLERDEEYGDEKEIMAKAGEIAMDMLKSKVRPEFLNRIDKTIIFEYLDRDNIREIVNLKFKGIQKKLIKNGIRITANEDAIDKMVDMSYEPEYGARPVNRMINDEILTRLSKDILSEKVTQDSVIEINVVDDDFEFRNILLKEKEAV